MRRFPAVLLLAFLLTAAPAMAQDPTFNAYPGPQELVAGAGEPSIGFNPKTNQVLFQSSTTTARVDFGKLPPTWTDATSPQSVFTADPILWTDRDTGRTLASQLILACSIASVSDDDGATWLPSQGCGIGTLYDHQTLGGGPYVGDQPVGGLTSYPNAVYYCAQGDAFASCATSRDGGLTFGPARTLYTSSQCAFGLHGHLKAAPNGIAYVPIFDCGGAQTLAESADNGLTWTLEKIPGSTTQDESDPHLGVGKDGSLYLGYQGGDGADLGDKGYLGHARSQGLAWVTTKPAGTTKWTAPIDVGAGLGVKNTQFPELWAGDDDRAAYAFLGTTTEGDDQSKDFPGVWHLYVAYTFDRGSTWTTYDATPQDPVQRGCIWLQGGSSECRNLLDFNDITIDERGRVLVAMADGCIDDCVTDPADTHKTELGTIVRQESGRTLLKAFDATGGAAANGTPLPGTTGTSGPGTGTGTGTPASGGGGCRVEQLTVAPGRTSAVIGGAVATTASVYAQARGRSIGKARRVARLRVSGGKATWKTRRVKPGVYVVKAGTRQGVILVGKRGRASAAPAFTSYSPCSEITSLTLTRPVFGGRGRAPLQVRYTVATPGDAIVELLRGKKVVKALAATKAVPGNTFRSYLRPPRNAKRGLYSVRLRLRTATSGSVATVYARAL